MKKYLIIISFLVLSGCSYEGEKISTYLKKPETFIKDPHYKKYKESLADVESLYLQKEINFSEYSKQKKSIDEKYESEIQSRQRSIESN